ncbi:hypothetical protein LIER_32625 [Lithospermum erythrorhizon]|uniref:FLZ-type domain-containing protein n=1 Tax=Lithospermum erythrorhizon TaxID=34254 RepID=A0AAV3RY93_LITER
MVGLSVILEGSSCTMRNQSCTSQVVNKASMIIQSSPTSPTPSSPNPFSRKNKQGFGNAHVGFLHHCFLCKQNLMPGKDIFMYK